MSFVQAVLINTSKLPAVYWVPIEKNRRNQKMTNPQLEISNDETSEQEMLYKTIVIAPGCYSREMLELADEVPFEITAIVKINEMTHSLKFIKANYERAYAICELGVLERTSISTYIKFPTPEEIENFKAKMTQRNQENENEVLSEGQIRKRVAYQLGKQQFLSLYQKNCSCCATKKLI